MSKSISLNEIIEFLGDDIKAIYGDPANIEVRYLKDPQNTDEFTLDWINSLRPDKQKIAEVSEAKAIIAHPTIEYTTTLKKQCKVILLVGNPKLAVAKVGNAFFVEKPEPGIHPSAFVHAEAEIGKNVYIGPNASIGKCKIGDYCWIYPNVTIYDRTTIGKNVAIHAGAVICADGLGCQRLENGQLIEFPQFGGVVIGNNVYIGSNTQITSGALSNTVIGEGSRINGLSFIGGNCQLGNNIWITGSTMLAGSVIVGDNTTIFSRVIIREHCKIGQNVTIGMGSVVTKNIPTGEVWMGVPAKKNKVKYE